MKTLKFEEQTNPDILLKGGNECFSNEMEKCRKRSRVDYEYAFKMRVVDEVERHVWTYHQAQKHYGIQGKSTVLVWLRKYGKLDWRSPKKNTRKDVNLEKRIRQLEAALKKERDRTLVYETIFGVL